MLSVQLKGDNRRGGNEPNIALNGAWCLILLLLLCFGVSDGQICWEASNALFTGAELPQFIGGILPYGAGLAISAVFAWIFAFSLTARHISLRSALGWFANALALGIFLARLLYCLVEPAYYNSEWIFRFAAFRIWDGGMAMTGALVGILFTAKTVPESKLLTSFAAPLFLVGARLSEVFTQVGYGCSVNIEGIFCRQIGYSVRLNVSVLEAIAALFIFACILLTRNRCQGKDAVAGDKCVYAFMILYGVSQIFMESLRKDRHMVWGFTKVQQVLAILLVLIALIGLSKDRREKIHSLFITLCAAVLLICLEFAWDRADISEWILYGGYVFVLVMYLKAALCMLERSITKTKENGEE